MHLNASVARVWRVGFKNEVIADQFRYKWDKCSAEWVPEALKQQHITNGVLSEIMVPIY